MAQTTMGTYDPFDNLMVVNEQDHTGSALTTPATHNTTQLTNTNTSHFAQGSHTPPQPIPRCASYEPELSRQSPQI